MNIRCPRCDGSIMSGYGEIGCIMCARSFTEQGRELVPVVAITTDEPRYKWGRAMQGKYRTRVIYQNGW